MWMPHVSTINPRQFGLVLGGILHLPVSIWSRCADRPGPGPIISQEPLRCNKKPSPHRRSRVV